MAKENGPKTAFKAFGSPYSPRNGLWAFGYNPEEAKTLWDQIPLDTDVLITHTPPKSHCDRSRHEGVAGCESLRQTLWRIRPYLSACGHIHEGRGAEKIEWGLTSPNVRYQEINVAPWTDPGLNNKKQSTLDVSSKSPAPLQNSVAWLNIDRPSVDQQRAGVTRGQGSLPPSETCDMEALDGRMGRKETCVVNAAIMASSWPYPKSAGRYNKPIVVDIDLPVGELDGSLI